MAEFTNRPTSTTTDAHEGTRMAHHTSGLMKLLLAISVIGALNWGLVGLFNWNLVNAVFGGQTGLEQSTLSRVVYALVGLCGLGLAFMLPKLREVRRHERVAARTTLPGGRAEVRP